MIAHANHGARVLAIGGVCWLFAGPLGDFYRLGDRFLWLVGLGFGDRLRR